MIPTNEVLLIITSVSTALVLIWNTVQGGRIKELELKYKNLCFNCKYEFTPKEGLDWDIIKQ